MGSFLKLMLATRDVNKVRYPS